MKAMILCLSTFLIGASAFSQATGSSASGNVTAEQRSQMANAHERAASCLRSGKSMQECHNQMMENCPENDRGECMMTGMMGPGMHGMKSGRSTKSDSQKDSKKESQQNSK